jgi:hypothetical protein
MTSAVRLKIELQTMLHCEELLCGTDLQVVVQYGHLLYLQYGLLQSLQCGLYYELHFEC